jgi:hypothetical protein
MRARAAPIKKVGGFPPEASPLFEIAFARALRSRCLLHRKRESRHRVNGCETFLLFDDYQRAFRAGLEKVLGHWRPSAKRFHALSWHDYRRQ